MEAVPVDSLEQLAPARFGLLEPAPDLPALAPEQLELVVAPCLMAAPGGLRLGQGGGYYDRFLPRCRCRWCCFAPPVWFSPTCPPKLMTAGLILCLPKRVFFPEPKR